MPSPTTDGTDDCGELVYRPEDIDRACFAAHESILQRELSDEEVAGFPSEWIGRPAQRWGGEACCPVPPNLCGQTLLNTAILRGRVGTVRALLDRGAPVDLAGRMRAAPLHCACAHGVCAHGHTEIASLLLDRHAAVELESFDGTPLQVACAQQNLALVQLIVQRGANVNHAAPCKGEAAPFGVRPNRRFHDIMHCSPLHVACLSGNVQIVDVLLRNGADPSSRQQSLLDGQRGAAPLHVAADQGHADVVRRLHESGADLDLLHDGKSALDILPLQRVLSLRVLTSGRS